VSGRERSWLVDYLTSELLDRTDEAISRIVEMMDARGSVDFAVEYGRGIGAAAYEAFDASFHRIPPSPHRDFLRGLVGYMLNRDM
jgi:geranylgeranyl diphosphate synthase type II